MTHDDLAAIERALTHDVLAMCLPVRMLGTHWADSMRAIIINALRPLVVVPETRTCEHAKRRFQLNGDAYCNDCGVRLELKSKWTARPTRGAAPIMSETMHDIPRCTDRQCSPCVCASSATSPHCMYCLNPVEPAPMTTPDAPAPILSAGDVLLDITDKGGDHSESNTQLAHYGCNSRKGNRACGSQLRLGL